MQVQVLTPYLPSDSRIQISSPSMQSIMADGIFTIPQAHRTHRNIWVFLKKGVGHQNMVKIMENPIKMDDLGVPLFLETPIYVSKLGKV